MDLSRFSYGLLLAAALVIAGWVAWDSRTRAADAGYASPQELLAELYGLYADQPAGSGAEIENQSVIERYFVPGMAARIEANRAAAKLQSEVPAINGDPFVDAQEWQITDLSIAVTQAAGPDTATAVVTFKNIGKPKEIGLSLTKSKTGWKIADIDWGYDRLSAILGE